MTKEPIAMRKNSMRALLFVLDNSKTGCKDYVTIIRAATFSRDDIQRLTEVIQGDSAALMNLRPGMFIEVPGISQAPEGNSIHNFVGNWTQKLNLKTGKPLGLVYMSDQGNKILNDWITTHTGMFKNPKCGDYVFCATGHTERWAKEASQEAAETLQRFAIDTLQPE